MAEKQAEDKIRWKESFYLRPLIKLYLSYGKEGPPNWEAIHVEAHFETGEAGNLVRSEIITDHVNPISNLLIPTYIEMLNLAQTWLDNKWNEYYRPKLAKGTRP